MFEIGEVSCLTCELVVPVGLSGDEYLERHIIELATSDIDDETALLEPGMGPFTPITRNVVELSETFVFEEFGKETRRISARTARKCIEGARQVLLIARLNGAPKGHAATSQFLQIQGLPQGVMSSEFVRSKMTCGRGKQRTFIDPRVGTDFSFLGISAIARVRHWSRKRFPQASKHPSEFNHPDRDDLLFWGSKK